LVMVFFGPVAWKAFFVFLLLPYSYLYAVFSCRQLPANVRWYSAILLILAFVVATFASPAIIGNQLAELFQERSVFTILNLVVLAFLFWLHARIRALNESTLEKAAG
jgi:hypothetical protein